MAYVDIDYVEHRGLHLVPWAHGVAIHSRWWEIVGFEWSFDPVAALHLGRALVDELINEH